MRYEVTEMHLFDSDARDEEALCKAEVSVHDLNAVQDYLDRCGHGLSLPTVCEPCKVPAVRWAENHRLKLEADTGVYLAKADNLRKRDAVRYRKSVEEAEMEADRLLHEAEGYRRLADRLARETGPLIHMWALFCISVPGQELYGSLRRRAGPLSLA